MSITKSFEDLIRKQVIEPIYDFLCKNPEIDLTQAMLEEVVFHTFRRKKASRNITVELQPDFHKDDGLCCHFYRTSKNQRCGAQAEEGLYFCRQHLDTLQPSTLEKDLKYIENIDKIIDYLKKDDGTIDCEKNVSIKKLLCGDGKKREKVERDYEMSVFSAKEGLLIDLKTKFIAERNGSGSCVIIGKLDTAKKEIMKLTDSDKQYCETQKLSYVDGDRDVPDVPSDAMIDEIQTVGDLLTSKAVNRLSTFKSDLIQGGIIANDNDESEDENDSYVDESEEE